MDKRAKDKLVWSPGGNGGGTLLLTRTSGGLNVLSNCLFILDFRLSPCTEYSKFPLG